MASASERVRDLAAANVHPPRASIEPGDEPANPLVGKMPLRDMNSPSPHFLAFYHAGGREGTRLDGGGGSQETLLAKRLSAGKAMTPNVMAHPTACGDGQSSGPA